VAADIAVYEKGPARPTSGCGAVAMLIGPNAPLVVDSRTRTTHANHIWDFYKPDPHHEYPTVDGHHSQECYLRALDDCYQRFVEKNNTVINSKAQQEKEAFDLSKIDHVIFHSPYTKLVQKSYARVSKVIIH
jgi:hydroxymethylglutaryl-CoA synthase